MASRSSVRLLEDLPAPSDAVAATLLMTVRKPADVKKRVLLLTKRGYLGCLPFAHTKRDDIVLRVSPNVNASAAPVGVVFEAVRDGLTIAPNLKHFVAGRLAQLDYCNPIIKHTRAEEDGILEFAAELGGRESAQALLSACKEVGRITSSSERVGKLWTAVESFDPLFEVLGGAWTFHLNEVPAWLRRLRRRKAGSYPIIRNIRVSYHTAFETGENVANDAWNVVFGNHVFDLTYTGITRGRTTSSRMPNALTHAVNYLRENVSADHRFESPEWVAAQAVVDQPKYDGEAHMQAAMESISSDPSSAYTNMTNAAYYAGQAKSRLVSKIAETARDLAFEQKWSDLIEILDMAVV